MQVLLIVTEMMFTGEELVMTSTQGIFEDSMYSVISLACGVFDCPESIAIA